MANLKKEVMSLISRFDAAQEAFAANSVEVKALTKKHRKELKAAKAEAKAARIEVEALKAELAVLKLGAPAKRKPGRPKKATTAKAKPAAKRGPGRPKKASTTAAKPAAKRGPGRPKKATTTTAKPAAKRGPGRPKKATTKTAAPAKAAAKAPAKPAAKRGPGRPKKAATKTAAPAKAAATAKATTAAPKKRPGRPRTKPVVAKSGLESIKGVGPAMAKQFEAAGVKTPAAMAKLSNVKMAAILAKCGPRYRNADSAKMQAYRDAATAAK